jgi:hypothetical protein
MIVLEKQGDRSVLMRIAMRDGEYDPSQLQDQDKVYDSLQEFADSDPDNSSIIPALK